MTNNATIFNKIDQIIVRVHQFKMEPEFAREVCERNNRNSSEKIGEGQLLRFYATIVAFSKGANSKNVRDKLILTGAFEKMFQNFSVDKVSKINVTDFLSEYWIMPLTYIRMKEKITPLFQMFRRAFGTPDKY